MESYWEERYNILLEKLPKFLVIKVLYDLFMIKQNTLYEANIKFKHINFEEEAIYGINWPFIKRNIHNLEYMWYDGLVKTWTHIYHTNQFVLSPNIHVYGSNNAASMYMKFLKTLYYQYDEIEDFSYKMRRDKKKGIRLYNEEISYGKLKVKKSRRNWDLSGRKLKFHISEYFTRLEIQNSSLILKDY